MLQRLFSAFFSFDVFYFSPCNYQRYNTEHEYEKKKKSDSICFTNSENYKKDEKDNSEMDGVKEGSTFSTSYISLRHSMVLQKEAAGERKLYEFYTACVCMPHVLRVWGLAGG